MNIQENSNVTTLFPAAQVSWERPDTSLITGAATAPPPFPVDTLGSHWADWCTVTADAANAPLDYVGASLLTTAASLIGNSRTVCFGSWSQPSTIWTVLVGPPSAKKSPAMAPLKRAVGSLEAELVAAHDPDSGPSPQLRIADVTAQAAGEVAAHNPNGLLLQRDELSGWWEQIARSGGEGLWLEAYDAGPYTINRKGKAALQIESLNISVLGTAQPDPLRDLLEAKSDRGFASRYLYVYPEPTRGFRRPSRVDDTTAVAALRHLRDLNGDGQQTCYLSTSAEDAAAEWLTVHDERAHNADGQWAQWLGKQNGMLLRYALVFEHLWWCGEGDEEAPFEVSQAAVEAAGEFIDRYALPMAARSFNLAARSVAERQAAALARLLQRQGVSEFNARGVRRGDLGPVGPLSNAEVMDAACAALQAACLIRKNGVRAGSGKGRAPASYEVNPQLLRTGGVQPGAEAGR